MFMKVRELSLLRSLKMAGGQKLDLKSFNLILFTILKMVNQSFVLIDAFNVLVESSPMETQVPDIVCGLSSVSS